MRLAECDSVATPPGPRSPIDVIPAALEWEGVGRRYRLFEKPRDQLLKKLSALMPAWLPLPGISAGQDFRALPNLSLTVRADETVALIGRNLLDNSTLQLVAGNVAPSVSIQADSRGTPQ
jgi:ABC-type polysaccharide/polyol phosphate transport system ATPase subunit